MHVDTLPGLDGRALLLRATVAEFFGLPTVCRVSANCPWRVGQYVIIIRDGRWRIAYAGPAFFHTTTDDVPHCDARVLGVALPFSECVPFA